MQLRSSSVSWRVIERPPILVHLYGSLWLLSQEVMNRELASAFRTNAETKDGAYAFAPGWLNRQVTSHRAVAVGPPLRNTNLRARRLCKGLRRRLFHHPTLEFLHPLFIPSCQLAEIHISPRVQILFHICVVYRSDARLQRDRSSYTGCSKSNQERKGA